MTAPACEHESTTFVTRNVSGLRPNTKLHLLLRVSSIIDAVAGVRQLRLHVLVYR